mmetsp:Transcript_33556/g.99907  ORF Transcript_33556/g.99907 Transcript_33556/m.99907 type:complete len:222 (+) Transcript_33556:327-992(+)
MPEATPPKSGPDGGAEGPMKDAEPAGKVAKITKPLSPVQRRISAHKSRVAQALRPWATRATNMLTGTAWFAKLAKKTFHQFDIDHNGQLNEAELYACLLKINDELNFRLPTHVMGPNRADVSALMKKFDGDKSGGLDFDEFLKLARQVYGVTSLRFSVPVHVAVVILLRLLVLPIIANAIVAAGKAIGNGCGIFAWLPVSVWVVVLEVALRAVWASYLEPL